MIVDKNKPSKAKLYLEFVIDASDGKKVGWFALKKFPSFYNASKVEMKFQPVTGMKNQTFILDGLKDSTYQAQQICNSGHMLRASISRLRFEKIHRLFLLSPIVFANENNEIPLEVYMAQLDWKTGPSESLYVTYRCMGLTGLMWSMVNRFSRG